jgi:hypothetical protein
MAAPRFGPRRNRINLLVQVGGTIFRMLVLHTGTDKYGIISEVITLLISKPLMFQHLK